ncbi:MAG: hypothetical protein JWQ30_2022 [Sediminibacterium sp.]|nr:hypothetical protein [Sediminibacterium sp.]
MKNSYTTDINNLEDLHSEMRRVKQRINERENDLSARWNRLPEEAVKASVTAILPAFMGNQVASGVWKLVKAGYDFFYGDKNDKTGNSWKDTLAGGAKQVGLFGALKLLFSMWKGK